MQQLFFYIAAGSVLCGIAAAGIIAADLRRRPQPMAVMNTVWVLTALWASVFALAAYYAFGRAKGHDMPSEGEMCRTDEMTPGDHEMRHLHNRHPEAKASDSAGMRMDDMPGMKVDSMKGMDMGDGAGMKMDGMPEMKMDEMPGMQMPARPKWQSVVLSTLHCGAGCTLADLIGEWFLYFIPVVIGGSLVAGSWVVDYLLALVIGIGFQYAAIRSMEPSRPKGEIVVRAAKADFLSLTAWQVGMYAWMALVIFGLNAGEIPSRTGFTFWFMMQVAMGCGFIVALPMNVFLIRMGIKKGM